MFLVPDLDVVVGGGHDQKHCWDPILTNGIAVTHRGSVQFCSCPKKYFVVVFKVGFNPC